MQNLIFFQNANKTARAVVLFCLSFVLTICSLSSFAQEQPSNGENTVESDIVQAISGVTDNIAEGTETVYKDVKQLLQELAGPIGSTASHMWKVLVKQQTVKSVVYLCIGGLITWLFIILLRMSIKSLNSEECLYEKYEEGLYIFNIIIGLLLLVWTILFTYDIATGFVNPEYGAIREIIKKI